MFWEREKFLAHFRNQTMVHWLFFLLECLVGLMAGDGHSYLAIMFCPQLVSVIPGVFIFA